MQTTIFFNFAAMKLMIIDDNAGVRTALRLLLSKEFDEIAAIGDPTLIPALMQAGNIDAVLLDMNFQSDNLNGEEGLFWLSKIKSYPEPPCVVLITAFGDIELAVEGMKRGAEDFITKPWDNSLLIEKLKKGIAKNQLKRKEKRSVEAAKEIEQANSAREQMTLDQLKMDHVRLTIEKCGGNLSAAAERLGINRQTLYNLLKKGDKHQD